MAPDRPLIYVNEGFTRLTGFSIEETLGSNCRFLQGPETDPAAVRELREAIAEERKCEVELLNYRKDGSTFWNRLSITPVRNEVGQTTHFVGIQSDVTRRRVAELRLRDLNESLRSANDKMQRDLRAAAKIQHALLPTQTEFLSGTSIRWAYLPCDELAGDILDIFPIDANRVAFYVLDVSGHGVQAALLSTTLSRWLSRSSLELKTQPVEMLEHLNVNFQLDGDSQQFFTCCYGLLDLRALTLSFASAGHPSPILLRGSNIREFQLPGFPVGVVANPEYELEIIELRQGDRIFVYSDGAIEQAGQTGQQFGIARLMQELSANRSASLQSSIDLTLRAVLNSTSDGNSDDDISMLGIEIDA
ncbi:Blue-light-activated protein [Aureliella helgolandensis]|uniref:Blue-light-activated protein n=2 Tax=Aureliella helgolandensis TaxID=2527968 RepID=A0A518GCW6_9BACT|nr:Blue-light-activated protein [Aureliella helgolandensis]